jgi:hypothetical protein
MMLCFVNECRDHRNHETEVSKKWRKTKYQMFFIAPDAEMMGATVSAA